MTQTDSDFVTHKFSTIYRDHTWGGSSRSGEGSDPEYLAPYIDLLDRIVSLPQIRSVVDIGCGDWAFSRLVDWSGVDYTGVDIVQEAVDQNNKQFGSEDIRFVSRDLRNDELPNADICVVKDVLQHLSNESVAKFLNEKLNKFPFALITNDVRRFRPANWQTLWQRIERQKPNCQTSDGGSRPLKLLDPPFNIDGVVVLSMSQPVGNYVYEKESILIGRDRRLLNL